MSYMKKILTCTLILLFIASMKCEEDNINCNQEGSDEQAFYEELQSKVFPSGRYWIETDELDSLMKAKFYGLSIKIIDATIIDDTSSYDRERIPGAIFFNHYEICDQESQFPVMLPSEAQFRKQMQELDIKTTDILIFYDTINNSGAVRAWYIFDVFGHKNKYVLNGTFKKWKFEHKIIENDEPKQNIAGENPEDYKYIYNKNVVENYSDILNFGKNYNELQDKFQLIDVRPIAKYYEFGHIPGSVHIPHTNIILPEKKFCFKDMESLERIIKKKIQPNKKVMIMCNRGVTAAFLYVILKSFNIDNVSIYDGSWSEYARMTDAIIVKD